jgi:malonate-semialdehyde dehydrogenase (acetylating)/methylmalonate-semialdehyde dehydrogenase
MAKQVGYGMHPDTDIGPIITKDAQRRIEALIQQGVDDGAQLLLDGRGVRVPGFEEGNFVGPTILAVDLRGSFDSTARPVVGSMCLQVLSLIYCCSFPAWS